MSGIGLGTYAFFWRHQATLPDGSAGEPIDLPEMLRRSARLGAQVFQVCDYAPLLGFSAAELRGVRSLAADLGLTLELGTRGVAPAHLSTYLDLAGVLEASVVRSMLFAPGSRPTLAEAERMLRTALPAYEAAGVALALETYEQVPSSDLVALIETIASPSLGICLDPANCVAALENPTDVVERCAPYVMNIHVKDFAFARQAGWVGFELAGAPLGTGLLDYDHLVRTVDPAGRGISRIVEHWVPWQGDLAATVAIEDDWTSRNIRYLKEHS
jgi:sugar phosphate isomerase/epimerase